MRRPSRPCPFPPPAGASTDFVRGFVSSGLLCALQSQGKKAAKPAGGREVLRRALQGGTALAAGTAAVTALQRRHYSGALLAVAGGAAGLIAIEYLLHEQACNDKEKDDGQEEA